jgi:hypothetical protein
LPSNETLNKRLNQEANWNMYKRNLYNSIVTSSNRITTAKDRPKTSNTMNSKISCLSNNVELIRNSQHNDKQKTSRTNNSEFSRIVNQISSKLNYSNNIESFTKTNNLINKKIFLL